MSIDSDVVAAVKAGNGAEIDRLLNADPAAATAVGADGVSALMLALYYGRTQIAARLRQQRQTITIWEAAALGEVAAIKAAFAADQKLVNQCSVDGFPPLGLAAFFGRVDCMVALIEAGAAVNAEAANGMRVRPIHSAAAHRQPDVALQMLQVLVAHGADVNVAQRQGWTPLHQAAEHGHADMVTLLLAHGANREAVSDDGRTPRMMAQAKNDRAILNLFDTT